MAEQCELNAKAMNVGHITSTIRWGEKPFPRKPTAASTESTARLARYHLLFENMAQYQNNVIALGHHADDQVETCLMRVAKGSTLYGAAGMKAIRRWGMTISGSKDILGWTGELGLSKWIIRPLLPFPKVTPKKQTESMTQQVCRIVY
jgi:tRNA(Ile)-lysidine synthase